VKGKTQVLPVAGPDTTEHVGDGVVVVVVVVEHTLVVHTKVWVELQTQVLQSTVESCPGVQVPEETVVVVVEGVVVVDSVVVVVVVVVVLVDSTWHDDVEPVSQSPQALLTTTPELSVAVAHQGRGESL
jgi:hypothetical protein